MGVLYIYREGSTRRDVRMGVPTCFGVVFLF